MSDESVMSMVSPGGLCTAPGGLLADQALRGVARFQLVVQAEAVDMRVSACRRLLGGERETSRGEHERRRRPVRNNGCVPMRSMRVRSLTDAALAPAMDTDACRPGRYEVVECTGVSSIERHAI